MKNIFLAPRSNETAYEHFESTINHGRPYSEIEPFLTDSEKKILSNQDPVRVWGNKESLKSRWKVMKPGDYVLFYERGIFISCGRVLLTKFSPQLALKLWPAGADGRPWPCLYFFDDLREVIIPMSVIQAFGDYSPEFNILQGFMRLSDKGLKSIIEKCGSIEAFLNQPPDTYVPLGDAIDRLTEETVSGETEDEVDTDALLKSASEYRAPDETRLVPNRVVRIENRTQKKRIASIEHWTCQVCGWSMEWKNKKGKKMNIIEVDHIIEKASGGTEELGNLWVLCPNCHAKKTHGIIVIDPIHKKVTENGKVFIPKSDNHLFWWNKSIK